MAQELNDRRLTLVEGSVLADSDLVRCRLEHAAACMVLGDRFTEDADAEDLDVLFRVWAIKAYTKQVPLAVQVRGTRGAGWTGGPADELTGGGCGWW